MGLIVNRKGDYSSIVDIHISRMMNKLNSIVNIPFLVCLTILLLNDFYLKSVYHNWLTGKLSDFCGLFVFVWFLDALIPNRKVAIYLSTALLFVFWKSPHSQSFIDIISLWFYPINRVVDMTDLLALMVLPVSFYYKPPIIKGLSLNPIPLAFLTVFSFCATSIPQPTRIFEQPQYLLFKSGIIDFESSDYPSNYDVYYLDSLLIINIKSIRIDKRASIDDDFHKVQILKDIDLRLLRELKEEYRTQRPLNEYVVQRDSLAEVGSTSIILNLDSISDELNFSRARLNGDFKRYSKEHQLIIQGKYKNGIEDSIWTFYSSNREIHSRKYFENGELIKIEMFGKNKLKSKRKVNSREMTIRDKYFHLAIIFLLFFSLLVKIYINLRRSENKNIVQLSNFSKVTGTLILPLGILLLAKIISSIIPNSYTNFFLGIFGEVFLVYIVTTPLFLLIFYYLKLRSKLDLIYYILLLSLAIVFTEELIYLRSII
jgi:hypothetical protein